ncbi:MAG TPA: phosphatidylcholine/phosphatidylserine synthase [Sphingobium sp.]|nr:phosphatidylcholine/phosphatidylserine synthase [Sphingobium sp.]
MIDRRPRAIRLRRSISLRQVAPNAVTAMALCFGLTAIRFAIVGNDPEQAGLDAAARSATWFWEMAVGAIIVAGVLDGIDGRIARLLRAESRFGAELDSLSDSIAFGVSPAILLYLWSLQEMPRFGWIAALGLALSCALRLARFNANLDEIDQPRKRAGFLTGVPAPAGAGLALLPLYAWFVTGNDLFRDWRLVAPWTLFAAFLMISNLPTLGWKRLRVPPSWRLFAIMAAGLFAAMLMVAPWISLLALTLAYLAFIPLGLVSYMKLRRRAGFTPLAAEPDERAPEGGPEAP